ncbi:hypothetical protein [Algoriphagus taiwanensis]|uniref:SH3 domain-containing protein n=1 Tax=Algoriphagus taiwanensis TaxID=1445656 RepID=A0ABQ6Q159_9BACT|nr:hypothetical protein Ataiwa_21710 [Algoriphagus taiwanensis]
MKKLLFFFLVALTLSCQEDTEPANPTNPTNPPVGENPAGNFETQEVQIVLPEGSSLDLTGAELLSFGNKFPVENGGKTKAIATPGEGSVTYLLDKNGEIILMGYLSSNQTRLSPQTTADVLLYLGSRLWLIPGQNAPSFFSKINEVPAGLAWREEFEGLWKQDPLILSKGSFTEPLSGVLKSIMPEPNELDIRAKVSDIQVDAADIRSGIQVFESDLGKISVTNSYRRRAHAFLYKISSKDESGVKTTLIDNLGGNTPAKEDFIIDPASAANSLTGILGSLVENIQSEIAAKTSGPASLPLEDKESEAEYRLHIVGPGISSTNPKTEAEFLKLTRLEVETFAIDFMFPLIMEIFGYKGELKEGGIDIKNGRVEAFIEKTEVYLKASPDVYDEIKKGQYSGALRKAVEKVYAGTVESKFSDLAWLGFDLMREFGKDYVKGFPKVDPSKSEEVFESAGRVLKVLNSALLAGDFLRIGLDFRNSRQFEEWTVTARSAKVSLLPAEATVSSRGNKEIKAEIKNLEEEGGDNFPYFKWSTSGKYGYIQDKKGNKGKEFDSSDKEIIYYSETSASDLPEENNFEYVYLEAYYKNQLIGRDTTVLNLKKSSYMLKPGGLVLSGKEDLINSAKLFIEPVNQRDADFTGKKVVWTTEGKHGRFVSLDGISNVITSYDTNSITYVCSDKETKKGTETVKARIYEKSAVDGEYFLYEELTLQIEIDNSDNIKIITVDLQVKSFQNQTGNYLNCGSGVHFLIDPQPNAISYTAKIIDFYPAPNIMVGRSSTWSADKVPDEDGKYEFSYVFVKSGSRPENKGWPDCGGFAAEAGKYKGKAQVVIRLKDPG